MVSPPLPPPPSLLSSSFQLLGQGCWGSSHGVTPWANPAATRPASGELGCALPIPGSLFPLLGLCGSKVNTPRACRKEGVSGAQGPRREEEKKQERERSLYLA